MKRGLSFVLLVVMIVGLFSFNLTVSLADDMYDDTELNRAVELGFGPFRSDNPEITYSDFMAMLTRTVELADASKLDSWNNWSELDKARNSMRNITRSNAFFATLCAAETLGERYTAHNIPDWGLLWNRMGNNEGNTARNYQLDDSIFSPEFYLETPNTLFNPQDDYENRASDALVFSFSRISLNSGKSLFDIDEISETMRPEQPLTYTEGMLSALRLYDSWHEPATTVPTIARTQADLIELDRAAKLGIGSYDPNVAEEEIVTVDQYMMLLDRVVKLVDNTKLDKWIAAFPAARSETRTMSRFDGMVATFFAAYYLNDGNLSIDYWEIPYYDHPAMHDIIIIYDETIFPQNSGMFLTIGPDVNNTTGSIESSYDTIPYWYSYEKLSHFSGEPIFEYDKASESMRINDPFTYSEALLAAVRLYDTYPHGEIIERDPTAEADAQILRDAEESKQAILNTPTTIEVTGKKYYVSNSGDDRNDGLSPEKALATLGGARGMNPEPGDGVFLERGGTWRERVDCMGGVTYSAYGEGLKPRILNSPESGVGADKWELFYDAQGKKVWKFYNEMQETSVIVFNDGDSYAKRIIPLWNGHEFVYPFDQTKPFDLAEGLGEDLTFVSTYDMSAYTELPVVPFQMMTTGPIYLRCDAGNPGELYSSIEFASTTGEDTNTYMGMIMGGRGNVILDNLCIMYGSMIGITGSNLGITVQNCEVAWIGGAVFFYEATVPHTGLELGGGAIGISGENNTIHNNYIHDVAGSAVSAELETSAFSVNSTVIDGNLIERCQTGVAFGTHADSGSSLGDIQISNNIILHNGYDYSNDIFDWLYQGKTAELYHGHHARVSIIFNIDNSNRIDGTVNVTGNTLYQSKYTLVALAYNPEFIPNYSGNTYAQNIGALIANMKPFIYSITGDYWASDSALAQAQLADKLGDLIGVVLP
ncbi:hypothetical protein AGMMS49992_12240 [Clostridia bacterium]|nr:hypothetical protein AGMMS49992_12240 [Clostridia bacterium]